MKKQPKRARPAQLSHHNRFLSRPTTQVAWWALILFGIFVVMFAVNSFVFMRRDVAILWVRVLLIAYGIAMLLCGLAAGVLTLIALIWQRERSWLIWIPLLPALWVIFMLVGEFLGPPH